MAERPLDTTIVMLKRAHFDVVLGVDHGQFQKLVMAAWPTILETLEDRAKRERNLTLVKK